MSENPNQPTVWDPSRLHFEFPIPDRKLRCQELILYIGQACVTDPTFSKVKLLKVLFYSDFESYGKYGSPITGQQYRKLQFGPAPAAYQSMQEEMIRSRLIRVVQEGVYDYASDRVLPLRDPNLDLFTARDISIVASWVRVFWGKTARDISDYSHGKAWESAQLYELIPYEAAFISDEIITFEDMERVRELTARFGWKV